MDKFLEFMQINAKRERAIKLERFKQLNPTSIKGQIVFSGSSLTEQFPINEMLQNLDQRYILYNRGIGGDTTYNLLEDIDVCIFDLCPSKLFINIGSNDIGSPDYNEEILFSNYEKILNQIKERLPNTKVYLLSYYPVNPYKESDIPNEYKSTMFATRTNKTISSANKRASLLAEHFNYTYIDVSSPLFDADGNLKEEYTLEGIHMWPIAYQKVLEILIKYFE